VIELKHLTKNYRAGQEVVSGLDLTIPTGLICVLIGSSGCGKTTTLKMINRLVSITSGQVLIDGRDNMDYDPIELRRGMGYVIQQSGLFPHMTVKENIEIIPTLEKKDKRQIAERTIELMKMVDLDPGEFLDRYPTQLSGGQLQRVGVARAFATDPDIILMDEPFSALDPITRAQLQDGLLELQASQNKTIVFVTHDMDEAMKLGDVVCIMKEGKVVQFGTPEQIMKDPADDYVADFVGRNRIWSNPQYIKAADIMITDPFTIPETMSMLKAIEQMRRRRVTSAMVLDRRRKFKGVISALDIQRHFVHSAPVAPWVKPPAVTARPDDNIVELLGKVNEQAITTVPVLSEDNDLLGLITSASLVTTLSQQYKTADDREEAGVS
jgi:osmoprotectant transport system ATP-binding protein